MAHKLTFFHKFMNTCLFIGGPIGITWYEHRKLKAYEARMEQKYPGYVVKYRSHDKGFDSKQPSPYLERKDGPSTTQQ